MNTALVTTHRSRKLKVEFQWRLTDDAAVQLTGALGVQTLKADQMEYPIHRIVGASDTYVPARRRTKMLGPLSF